MQRECWHVSFFKQKLTTLKEVIEISYVSVLYSIFKFDLATMNVLYGVMTAIRF